MQLQNRAGKLQIVALSKAQRGSCLKRKGQKSEIHEERAQDAPFPTVWCTRQESNLRP